MVSSRPAKTRGEHAERETEQHAGQVAEQQAADGDEKRLEEIAAFDGAEQNTSKPGAEAAGRAAGETAGWAMTHCHARRRSRKKTSGHDNAVHGGSMADAR